jgi:hypothetical protein
MRAQEVIRLSHRRQLGDGERDHRAVEVGALLRMLCEVLEHRHSEGELHPGLPARHDPRE